MARSREQVRQSREFLGPVVPSRRTQIYEILRGISIWPFPLNPRCPLSLRGQTIIITGATRGIGLEVAKSLLEHGARRLIIGARLPTGKRQYTWDEVKRRLDAGPGEPNERRVEIWEVDYASFKSVRGFADRWNREGKECDVFISNVAVASEHRTKSKDGWEIHYQVNYLSHFLLTMLLLPSIKRATSPRIVLTTSVMHWFGPPINWRDPNFTTMTQRQWMGGGIWLAYARPKLFLTMFSRELQDRLDRSKTGKQVHVLAIHPGNTDTDIYRRFYAFSNPYEIIRSIIIFFVCLVGLSARSAAVAVVKGVVSDEDGRGEAGLGGRYWSRGHAAMPRAEVMDGAARKKLWDRTRVHTMMKEAEVTVP